MSDVSPEFLLGLMVAILLVMLLSPFVCPWLDGLEKVAQEYGFLEKADVSGVFVSPFPDYVWPGLKSDKLATSAAGIAGTLLVFGIGYGLGALIKRR